MPIRSFTVLAFIYILSVGCGDQDDTYPLAVTKRASNTTTVKETYTFAYRRNKLSTFTSLIGTTTQTLKFNFTGDQLIYISGDSTSSSVKKTFLYHFGDNDVDSTFFIDADTTYLMSTRTIIYDATRNPTSVRIKTWTSSEDTIVVTDNLAELEWTGGNVTHLTISDLSTGEKQITTDRTIAYDGERCVYTNRPEYIYTLKLADLHWLSANNPVSFNEGATVKEYSYSYNKLGYPSTYLNDEGVTFGMSYTQWR